MYEIEGVGEARPLAQLATVIDSRLSLKTSSAVPNQLLAIHVHSPVWLPLTCLDMRQPTFVLDLVVAAALNVSSFRPVRVAVDLAHFVVTEQLVSIVLISLIGLAIVDPSEELIILELYVHDCGVGLGVRSRAVFHADGV